VRTVFRATAGKLDKNECRDRCERDEQQNQRAPGYHG
jgi:hypothetical protein